MIYDAAIIGTGPAGLSAALNLKIHNKSFIWLGSKDLSDKVQKAEQIANYPGLCNVSGPELTEAFQKQIEEMGLEITELMVNTIMKFGDAFALLAGPEYYQARNIILATGIAMQNTIPGEAEHVGRGVSYCATCDGGLYRGKTIAVYCNNPRFEHEVKYLTELAGKVYYFPTFRQTDISPEKESNVEIIRSRITGLEDKEGRVSGLLLADGTKLAVDGLFCLRDSIALNTLLPGLETEDGHIKVDRHMATSIPGVYAAGDCTGRPYQYTKAVGEGNVAAHSVIESID